MEIWDFDKIWEIIFQFSRFWKKQMNEAKEWTNETKRSCGKLFTPDNHQAFKENNRRQQGANLGDQHYASHAVTLLGVHQNTMMGY